MPISDAEIQTLRNIEAEVEASKRRDCAEFADCIQIEMGNGCPQGCGAYNKISEETEADLRKCECPDPEGHDRLKLELAHVSYGHWVVLCHNCGALSHACGSKSSAVEHWNANELQRAVGYNTSDARKAQDAHIMKWIVGHAQ